VVQQAIYVVDGAFVDGSELLLRRRGAAVRLAMAAYGAAFALK
jgi:hypothetical protein